MAAKNANNSIKRYTALAMAVAMIGLSSSANAWADADAVDLNVVDRDTGQVIPIWRHHGRLFIAGQPGARYGLRLVNHTDARVLVVLSIDGVNVLTGETAAYDQRGYVFTPNQSYDVNGWRKSNTEVAAFIFAPLSQSYASRTGRPSDVGVIGMAVFQEKVVVPTPSIVMPPIQPGWRTQPSPNASGTADAPVSRHAGPLSAVRAPIAPPAAIPPPSLMIPPAPKALSPAPAPAPPPPPAPVPSEARLLSGGPRDETADARGAPLRTEKLGTAHGERELSLATITTFVRATAYPQVVRQIEYDSLGNLVAKGVIPRTWNASQRPRPFPARPDGAGFVPDPPNAP